MIETEDLASQVVRFANTIDDLVRGCLPDAPDVEVDQVGDRYRVQPVGQSEKNGGVPLSVDGERLAWLRPSYLCRLDGVNRFLAIDASKVWIIADVDKTPIFRFEYLYDADTVPHSHIHVHGQRGALSHLLSRTGHAAPHDMASLHLPTGGSRFRPNLEDVLQFLLSDCGFDAVGDWRAAVDRARAEWRATQVRAVTRALPEFAADQLADMGYTITPPPGGHPAPAMKALYAW